MQNVKNGGKLENNEFIMVNCIYDTVFLSIGGLSVSYDPY